MFSKTQTKTNKKNFENVDTCSKTLLEGLIDISNDASRALIEIPVGILTDERHVSDRIGYPRQIQKCLIGGPNFDQEDTNCAITDSINITILS